MLHVGSRSDPSIKNLVFTVVTVLTIAVYSIISIATGDWFWFSQKFSETPHTVVVYCFGESVEFEPGSYHFKALTEIVNEQMSGRKRWDSLSLSEATYQEYQNSPRMKVIEFYYPEPVRVHNTSKFFSSVDTLIIPLEGRHAQTNAVFGQNDGVSSAGSLHIKSTERLDQYLQNQKICPDELSGE
ncbi:MAG TPA: hypothetical protein VGA03_07150 [Anaerolineales bacterium]